MPSVAERGPRCKSGIPALQQGRRFAFHGFERREDARIIMVRLIYPRGDGATSSSAQVGRVPTGYGELVELALM